MEHETSGQEDVTEFRTSNVFTYRPTRSIDHEPNANLTSLLPFPTKATCTESQIAKSPVKDAKRPSIRFPIRCPASGREECLEEIQERERDCYIGDKMYRCLRRVEIDVTRSE